PPSSPLFPYTTLFRSTDHATNEYNGDNCAEQRRRPFGTTEAQERAEREHAREREPPDPAETSTARDSENTERQREEQHPRRALGDRKSTRLNSSHVSI